MQQRYNAIIIGFGKGGKTLAAYLADQGQSVAIVERSDKMYGGTCINIACIPTKTLVYEAHKSLCRGEQRFEEKAADYRRAIARKNEVTPVSCVAKTTPCSPTGTMWTSSRDGLVRFSA